MARVLIVEDHNDILTQTDLSVFRLGHQVSRVFGVIAALTKTERESFDLIIVSQHQTTILTPNIITTLLNHADKTCALALRVSNTALINEHFESFFSNDRVHFIPESVNPRKFIDTLKSILSLKRKVSKIDVRFLNPFFETTLEILKEYGFVNSKKLPLYLKKEQEPSGDISAIVGITSPVFQASLSISFQESSYLQLLNSMFPKKYSELNSTNAEIIATFLGTIIDRTRPILMSNGLSMNFAPPSILCSKGHLVNHDSSQPTIVMPFVDEGFGNFRIEFCARK